MTRKRRKKRRALRRLFLLSLCFLLILAGFTLIRRHYMKSMYPLEHSGYVTKYAKEYDVDPALVFAVIKTESSFDENARSRADARGLMQITEATKNFIAEKSGFDVPAGDEIFDPETNIKYGVFFLSYLISDFDNEIDTALAAYNAGRSRVKGWLSDPSCSKDQKTLYYIPYTETRHYVEKVNKAMSMYQNLYFQ